MRPSNYLLNSVKVIYLSAFSLGRTILFNHGRITVTGGVIFDKNENTWCCALKREPDINVLYYSDTGKYTEFPIGRYLSKPGQVYQLNN